MQLESEEGRGSTFHFTLKLAINENRKRYINEDKVKHLSSFPGIRVMVAEDNAINMSIARRFLMKWGIEVKEAYNGKQAVDLFAQHSFDLVLIDLEMPEMDGITALGEIKKINPSVPAIAFTAAVYDNMRADLLSKGFMKSVLSSGPLPAALSTEFVFIKLQATQALISVSCILLREKEWRRRPLSMKQQRAGRLLISPLRYQQTQ